ncbi:ABC transporter substrate-binding protein [Bosea sp. (in: a-proteobacteria)]|jgi:branched-chain amino acid transport system substrate-binding protein|uniref:ABC transporter substrate-binding protein n=1 Tax=Bosea sp. (in: a-proteobacteria) TaxID=1871050 RepID=UPI002DDCA6BD|nr:ABC transporter substrate-binding protein [Bosea sp. (in: a-proteobacteria)]HEV2510327.1 ABC transporter substrate-binding protein [Bosea sp. (in: a-proteobacteria)]
MLRSTLGAGAAFAAAMVLPQPSLAQAPAGDPLKIGAIISLTGPGAGLGHPQRQAMSLAEKTINAAGGVNGRPIRIVIEDDGSKPDIAKTKAERLMYDEKVIAIIGPSLTASTGAAAAITNGEGLPTLSFTGLGPKIELSYKSLFHLLPPQELNARAMLEYATKELKAKKVGILHDTGYGQVVTNQLNEWRERYGVEFVAVEKFEVGASDVSAQAAKIRAAGPDAVFVIATSAVPFRNARQVKIDQPIVSAIGSATYDYVRGFGEYGDNIIFPEFLVGEQPKDNQKGFVELFHKEYGSFPKNQEAAAWDGVHIVAKAAAKAGPKAGPKELSAAIREPYAGVMAAYDFSKDDMTGVQLSSYVFSKLVKGRFERLLFTVK